MDVVKTDKEDREEALAEHSKYKAEMNQAIFLIKDELDTLLQNPNMIA